MSDVLAALRGSIPQNQSMGAPGSFMNQAMKLSGVPQLQQMTPQQAPPQVGHGGVPGQAQGQIPGLPPGVDINQLIQFLPILQALQGGFRPV